MKLTIDEQIMAESTQQYLEVKIVDWKSTSFESRKKIAFKELDDYKNRLTAAQWDHKYPNFNMEACKRHLEILISK